MSVKFIGRWPDKDERQRVAEALALVVPVDEDWAVALATGKEQVITYNSSHPFELPGDKPLTTLPAAALQQPPRYILYHRHLQWLAFTAPTIPILMLAVQLYYRVGVDAIKELVLQGPGAGPSVSSA